MELSNYIVVNEKGMLIYLADRGKWYEIIGFTDGSFKLVEIK